MVLKMKTEIIKKAPVEEMIKQELKKQKKTMQISSNYYEILDEEVKRLLKKLIQKSIKNTKPEEKRLMRKHIERILNQE